MFPAADMTITSRASYGLCCALYLLFYQDMATSYLRAERYASIATA